jgi:hypothetical protein
MPAIQEDQIQSLKSTELSPMRTGRGRHKKDGVKEETREMASVRLDCLLWHEFQTGVKVWEHPAGSDDSETTVPQTQESGFCQKLKPKPASSKSLPPSQKELSRRGVYICNPCYSGDGEKREWRPEANLSKSLRPCQKQKTWGGVCLKW